MLRLLIAVVVSYLVGGFPTALVTGKVFRGIDIRQHGSGNAGATNAFRVLGWKVALPVMIVDVLKGTFATLVISKLAVGSVAWPVAAVELACGVAAGLGHIWTPYAGFRGGKGVGTALGVMIGLAPLAMLFAALLWFALVMFTGYVSVGSMLGAISVPFFVALAARLQHRPVDTVTLVATVFLAVLIVFTHRSNIRRLLSGTENRFNTPFVRKRQAEAT